MTRPGGIDDATLRALGILPHARGVEECRNFIARYLKASESDDPAAEMAFFAEQVDYMDEGELHAVDLKAELAAYRRNWPERHLKLLHLVASQNPANPQEMIVTYRYGFDVHGSTGRERKGGRGSACRHAAARRR